MEALQAKVAALEAENATLKRKVGTLEAENAQLKARPVLEADVLAGFSGELKGGKRHGKGTHTAADGHKYVGQWKDDKKHGQGTMTSADGDKYVGQWKDDKMHGLGKYTFPDGTVGHDGEWVNGESKE